MIAGEGPATPSLQRQALRDGLAGSVRFIVGYLERRRRLPDCYAAADVFVFASRTETQGLVLLEAMAAGLPVVALAAMGTTDILAPSAAPASPPTRRRASPRWSKRCSPTAACAGSSPPRRAATRASGPTP